MATRLIELPTSTSVDDEDNILVYDTETQELSRITPKDLTDSLPLVHEAPSTGVILGRRDEEWVPITLGTGVEEAPLDSSTYGRQEASWVSIPTRLEEQGDVNISTPTDQQTLVYDGSSGMWVLKDPIIPLSFVKFKYKTEVPADSTPAVGRLSWDNVNPSLNTLLYVNEIDDTVSNISYFIENILLNSLIYIIQTDNSANRHVYEVAGSPIKLGQIWQIPVTVVNIAGSSIIDNKSVTFILKTQV